MKNLHWVILAPVILFAIVVSVRFLACGPDRKVVRVAKPVAKIIADDIVKNGIPKSLKDIEGLPYELKSCKRKVKYYIDTFDSEMVETRKEADFTIINESCYFIKGKKSYSLSLRFVDNYKYQDRSNGEIDIFNSETYTGTGANFKKDKKNNTYQHDPIGDGYSHHHGILCGAFNH